ncbi:MAG: hypothetical protein E3J56_12665 [Candidatus Aminicenantes bacterium]|nr:MAG: hypothetical protein E3J56_12665 [Candidatus Aminicenantes bacterium]
MEKVVTFKIKGVKPILMNNPDSMGKKEGGIRTRKIPTPEEEVKDKFYQTNGQLFIPSAAFKGALLTASVGMKIGKYAAIQRMKGGVFTVEDECLLFHPKTNSPLTPKDAVIDTRRAVVRGQGVLRSRPLIKDWMCELNLEIDDDFVTIEQVLDRLKAAGKYPGVLDFRPECSGPFGRFEVKM